MEIDQDRQVGLTLGLIDIDLLALGLAIGEILSDLDPALGNPGLELLAQELIKIEAIAPGLFDKALFDLRPGCLGRQLRHRRQRQGQNRAKSPDMKPTSHRDLPFIVVECAPHGCPRLSRSPLKLIAPTPSAGAKLHPNAADCLIP